MPERTTASESHLHLCSLPEAVLIVVVKFLSHADRKEARLSCKCLQQILDSTETSLSFNFRIHNDQAVSILKSWRRFPELKKAALTCYPRSHEETFLLLSHAQWPNLQELSFGDMEGNAGDYICQAIGDGVHLWPKLEVLRFTRCSFHLSGLIKLSKTCFGNLKVLNLGVSYPRSAGKEVTNALVELLAKCPQLEELSLECNGLDDTTLSKLLLSSNLPKLHSLNLQGNDVGKESIAALRAWTQLRKFKLGHIPMQTIAAMVNGTAPLYFLKSLKFRTRDLMRSKENLKKFKHSFPHLIDMGITSAFNIDIDPWVITSLFSTTWETLERVALRNIKFRSNDVSALAECSVKLPHLTTLDLSETHLTNRRLQLLLSRPWTSLKLLNISDCRGMDEVGLIFIHDAVFTEGTLPNLNDLHFDCASTGKRKLYNKVRAKLMDLAETFRAHEREVMIKLNAEFIQVKHKCDGTIGVFVMDLEGNVLDEK